MRTIGRRVGVRIHPDGVDHPQTTATATVAGGSTGSKIVLVPRVPRPRLGLLAAIRQSPFVAATATKTFTISPSQQRQLNQGLGILLDLGADGAATADTDKDKSESASESDEKKTKESSEESSGD